MNRILIFIRFLAVAVVAGLVFSGNAVARSIPGVDDPAIGTSTFNLVAKADYISNPDGNTIYTWGYADASTGVMQYPGPTLIVNQGDTVTVNLTSELPLDTRSSIVFPGLTATASGGAAGVITRESTGPANTVTYTFTASQPGTFQYYSGTRPDLQVQMGLIGAIIVRPTGFDPAAPTAYGHSDSAYDHEHLFLLSEMDNDIHLGADMIALFATPTNGLNFDLIDTTSFKPVYWFINGRSLPDTLMSDSVPWLPNQPYGALVQANPGDKVLLRMIGSGVDGHPLHTHGDNLLIIARDGKFLESAPGAGADLSFSRNTSDPLPGSTMDGIFQWTGRGMGWDIYGVNGTLDGVTGSGTGFDHSCLDAVDNETGFPATSGDFIPGDGHDDTTWEWCEDHNKPLPVALPSLLDMSFGGFWGGSPFLGHNAALPPGEGGLNAAGGFTFPWHSHHEVEVINFDVFPGGMFTVFFVQPFSVTID